MSNRAWLGASLLTIPVLSDLLAASVAADSFWAQFLPNLYYVGLVIGGLALGWKWGLGIAVFGGGAHSVIGHFVQAVPTPRLEAQALLLLIVGFGFVEERKRATEIITRAFNNDTRIPQALTAGSMDQVSDVVSEILRDIRTPVASIGGAAFILSNKEDIAESQEFLDIILKECERLQRTLREIEECTETIPLRCEATEVSSLLSEVVRLSALEHPYPNIALQMDVAPGLPPLWCDPSRLRQAIVPFVTSTMDAIPTGGQILLAADRIDGQCRIQLKVLAQTVLASDPAAGRGPYSATFDEQSGRRILAARRTVMQHGGTIRIEESGSIRKLRFLTIPLCSDLHA